MATSPPVVMEEEDMVALVAIGEELTAASHDKQALGLQRVVALADANKDVSVYFNLICSVRHPPLHLSILFLSIYLFILPQKGNNPIYFCCPLLRRINSSFTVK